MADTRVASVIVVWFITTIISACCCTISISFLWQLIGKINRKSSLNRYKTKVTERELQIKCFCYWFLTDIIFFVILLLSILYMREGRLIAKLSTKSSLNNCQKLRMTKRVLQTVIKIVLLLLMVITAVINFCQCSVSITCSWHLAGRINGKKVH